VFLVHRLLANAPPRGHGEPLPGLMVSHLKPATALHAPEAFSLLDLPSQGVFSGKV